jgi:hypothetical protein
MSQVRIKTPPKETTAFEVKIERLRQFALWGRGLTFLSLLVVIFQVISPLLKNPVGQFQGGITLAYPVLFYVGSVVLDFLADVGIIVLSMKRETQYITQIVKEVREERPARPN